MDKYIIRFARDILSPNVLNNTDINEEIKLSFATKVSRWLRGFKPQELHYTRDIDLCVLAMCLGLDKEVELYLLQQYGDTDLSVLLEGINAVTTDSALWAATVGDRFCMRFLLSTPTIPFTAYAVPWLNYQPAKKKRTLLVASVSSKVNKVKQAKLLRLAYGLEKENDVWAD